MVTLPDADALPNTFVLHDRSFTGLMALRRWALVNGEGAQTGPQVSVPEMPPGEYTVCMGGQGDLAAALDGGRHLAKCATGTLMEGGELRLSVRR